MMRGRRWTKCAVWMAGLGLVLAGFLGIAAAAKDKIVLGYAVSLTGKFSTEATDTHRGYQLWAEEVNAKGGLLLRSLGKRLPVELKYYDDKSDPSTSAKLYERLITVDKVDLLFSPWSSGINFAISNITEKHKFPLMLSSAGSDKIYSRGFKHIFAASEVASQDALPIADLLRAKKGEIKSVAMLTENFIFNLSVREFLVEKLKEYGVNVVFDEKYPLGGQDFLSVMTRIRSLNPDAVLVLDLMPQGVYATRQLHEVGLKPKLYYVLIGPMFQNEFIKGLGPMAEGVVENGFWHQDLPYSSAKVFARAFQAKYNKPPSTDAAKAYYGAQVLHQAVEKTGSLDLAALNKTLHAEEFDTIAGPFKYDERGVNLKIKMFLTQVQNGKRVIVWPKELATSSLKFPVFK